jgi:hypothetical protein
MPSPAELPCSDILDGRVVGRLQLPPFLGERLRSVRAAERALWRRLRMVTREQWFLLVFALLSLAFVVALLVEPGSVGRGGR